MIVSVLSIFMTKPDFHLPTDIYKTLGLLCLKCFFCFWIKFSSNFMVVLPKLCFAVNNEMLWYIISGRAGLWWLAIHFEDAAAKWL